MLEVKNSVENLACSLASYVDLLLAKRTKMQVVDSSQEVVRNISQNLTVRFTGVCAMPPTFLGPVCEAIVAAGSDVLLEVEHYSQMIDAEGMSGCRRSNKVCKYRLCM